MIVSLARFTQADHQGQFVILASPGWFEIQVVLLSALDPRSSRRFLHSCLILYSDRSELLLFATQLRLNLQLSTFAVPTPPVQVYLQPAVGQGGGYWDEVESSPSQTLGGTSSRSSNAVES